MLYTAKRRKATELSLERNYLAMRDACEHLRLMDGNGISVSEEEAQRCGKEVGYFFRVAMLKNRVWGPSGGFPIEYARAQTDYPGKEAFSRGSCTLPVPSVCKL
jgi:large subunit ribosomal protein L40